jgi:enamine deaminase RidA (YjgF/YER057c/UK114 family)
VAPGACEIRAVLRLQETDQDHVAHISLLVAGCCFGGVARLGSTAIVSLMIFFPDPNDLPVIQKVRAEKFTAENAPASILIQTPGLVVPELLVELVPIAVVPHARYHEPKW